MPPGKDKDAGLSPEIPRLSAILTRDPNSKLFIALAEEYMKSGMAQEAVVTLEKGLKANPYYMSARVMLGKAYLEIGDAYKAREQFETVVKSIPDNLLAHKKLADIYREEGRLTEAARSLKMVILLNPKDEEAKKALAELESSPASTPSTSQEPPGGVKADSHVKEFDPRRIMYHDLAIIEVKDAAPESGTAESDHAAAEEPAPPSGAEPEIIEMPMPENMATLGEIPYAAEAEPADEPEFIPEPEEPAPSLEEEESPGAPGYGLKKDELEDIFGSYQDSLPGDEKKGEDTGGVYEIEGDISAFEIDGVKIEAAKKEPFETETLAELYISQGFYDRAINIYKNLLMVAPENGTIRQKLEELYLLATVNPPVAAPEAGIEAENAAPPGEPEYLVEPEEAGVYKGQAGYDTAAVRRLEQFLENIRRKAGR